MPGEFCVHFYANLTEEIMPVLGNKIPRKEASNNKLDNIAPGFGSDLTDPTEQNRRRSRSYVEDFANKERANLTRSRDERCSSYYC
jgi:hypothetical protein